MSKEIGGLIAQAHHAAARSAAQIKEIVAHVKKLPADADRDALITRCITELLVDPSDFLPARPPSKRTRGEHLAEAEYQRQYARLWARAGRSEKSDECIAAAVRAEEQAARLT